MRNKVRLGRFAHLTHPGPRRRANLCFLFNVLSRLPCIVNIRPTDYNRTQHLIYLRISTLSQSFLKPDYAPLLPSFGAPFNHLFRLDWLKKRLHTLLRRRRGI